MYCRKENEIMNEYCTLEAHYFTLFYCLLHDLNTNHETNNFE
jgi:hypothetical protein